MSEPIFSSASLCWCQVPVPEELETELLCVQHFLLGIEHDCAELRRETAQGKSNATRQSEIASYVKTTAMKLTQVATGRMRLTDEAYPHDIPDADEPSGEPRPRRQSYPGYAGAADRGCIWLILARLPTCLLKTDRLPAFPGHGHCACSQDLRAPSGFP